MKKIEETTIYQNIEKYLNSRGVIWDTSASEDTIKILFESIATYLGQVKKKTEPVGITINDSARGTFVFGAFVTFIPSAEDESKGNYNLTFTYDEEDMKEVDSKNIVDQKNPLFRNVLYSIGSRNYNMRFEADPNRDWVCYVVCACLLRIKEYMEANIKVDAKLEMTDYFEATAELDGEKIYVAIIPSAILKQHIKDDASIEAVE